MQAYFLFHLKFKLSIKSNFYIDMSYLKYNIVLCVLVTEMSIDMNITKQLGKLQ